jgi:hypothetical protein
MSDTSRTPYLIFAFIAVSLGVIGCDTQSANRIHAFSDSLSAANRRIHTLDSTLSYLRWDFNLYRLENAKGTIDFTSAGLQEIGNGFYVVGLALEQHLTGVAIKGRILNGTSLLHSNVELNLEIGGQTKDVTINSIPSQAAILFNVYVPDVPVDQTHWGQIKYVRSLINYYMK